MMPLPETSAYLIACSRPGAAKRAADAILLKLYCKKGGCGNCPDCARVKNAHPDIMRLDAPKVDSLREAISFVSIKPERYKAVVIENADDMNAAAANCILKTLEQPPENTVFLLLARSRSGVPPTVASRCAAVRISAEDGAEEKIKSVLGVDAATAHVLFDLSGGFFEEACEIYRDEAFMRMRAELLEMCEKLLRQKGFAVSRYADFIESNKDRLSALFCIMQSYYRDMLVYKKTKTPELIINRDAADKIMKAAPDFTSGALSNIISIILESERRFLAPVNFRLAAEKMLFCILEENAKWKK